MKLFINSKQIDLDKCEIYYKKEITQEILKSDFDAVSGEWTVDNDGWIDGIFRGNGGGMLYSKERFGANQILEFNAIPVPPCDNDLNFVLNTDGWNYEKGDAGRGYIGGMGGWWENKTGFEKYPSCKPWAATPLIKLESGKLYHIIAGCIDGHIFLFVNGQLVIELFDHDPSTLSDCGKFGLGTYASHIKYKDLVLYKPTFEPHRMSYTPKF